MNLGRTAITISWTGPWVPSRAQRMTSGDSHEHRRLLGLARAVALEEPSARDGFELLVRAVEHGWLDVTDLESLLEASRQSSWGGVVFEELGIEPDWRDARQTHLRVRFLADEISCPRKPFLAAIEQLCRACRAERSPELTLTDPATGAVYQVAHGASAVLGREPPADLVVPCPILARRHVLFDWTDGRCAVSILDAPGGAYLNGCRVVGRTPLRDGDELGLGGGVCLRVSHAPRRPLDA